MKFFLFVLHIWYVFFSVQHFMFSSYYFLFSELIVISLRTVFFVFILLWVH